MSQEWPKGLIWSVGVVQLPVSETGKTEEGIALGKAGFNNSDTDVKPEDSHSDVGCQARR